MGLREQAAADLHAILTDCLGFGWPITLAPPEGRAVDLVGFSTDISQLIDPETGQAVTGRLASVAISFASLREAALELPRNISENTRKPWMVTFKGIDGCAHTFKVCEANPDRALGVIICKLEAYKAL